MDEVATYSCLFTHNTIKNDPIQMMKLINKEVEVTYSSQKIVGTVYTIDPVSDM